MAGARRDELERRTRHQPEAVEARLFERWERECGFSGDPESDAETYVIALPPPNVTGELHMGHALNGSIQDTLMRLHRHARAQHAVDLRHRPRRRSPCTP